MSDRRAAGWLGACLATGLVLAGCSAADDRVPAPTGSPRGGFAAVSPSADGQDAAEAAADARIGWGNPGLNGTSISVPGCPGGASGWLAFVGGYTVRTSGCVPLIVRVDQMEERIAVGVGAPC
ncbi:hypothetical protein ACQP2E_16720 [Actinoplanes sp. CA-015351]|uniref:hypothetical protein n=1 Tax=Actinoplanes sp. CA-015351 TaxID=3239897 RepID=UPI003D990F5A